MSSKLLELPVSWQLKKRPNSFPCATPRIIIEGSVRTIDQTGVEMEALTAVSVAALTVYDMCKSHDREMTISSIHLLEKSGGKSGTYKRILDQNNAQ